VATESVDPGDSPLRPAARGGLSFSAYYAGADDSDAAAWCSMEDIGVSTY